MSPNASPSGRPSLRERRRAVAVAEILTTAEQHVVESGPHALSVRAVARSLGMTVQALYHYFPSRDALVTALIARAYGGLADAVHRGATGGAADGAVHGRPEAGDGSTGAGAEESAGDAGNGDPVGAAEGYRAWAVTNPELFQLVYGAPLRYYEAPADSPTTDAVRRMGRTFQQALFGAFTPEQLAAADVAGSPPLRTRLEEPSPRDLGGLPPPAQTLFLSAWGQVHGLVALEVFGHTVYLGAGRAAVFTATVRMMVADIHRRIPDARGTGPGTRTG